MRSATPGLRYYKAADQESGATSTNNAFTKYLATLLGVSNFRREIVNPPRDWMQLIANVQSFIEHETGGYIAVVECQNALVGNSRQWLEENIVKRALEARHNKSWEMWVRHDMYEMRICSYRIGIRHQQAAR